MISMHRRLWLSLWVGFLSLLMGFLLIHRIHYQNLIQDIQTRLYQHAMEYNSILAWRGDDLIWTHSNPPDYRFNQELSGLYASLVENERVIWRSASAPSRLPLPLSNQRHQAMSLGRSGTFSIPQEHERFYLYRFPVLLERDGVSRLVHIQIYEDATMTRLQMASFTQAILLASGLALLMMLLAQWVAARWGLHPLRVLHKDLCELQQGHSPHLVGDYPVELKDVKKSINDLMSYQKEQREVHQNALANLAHSLKTPLAIVAGFLDKKDQELSEKDRLEMVNQIQRMNKMVMLQLGAAHQSGRAAYEQDIDLVPIASDLVAALETLHKDRQLYCEFLFDHEQVLFPMSPHSAQELLGNVLENAFKWSKSKVSLNLDVNPGGDLIIEVQDDGPGVALEKAQDIMRRGVRADEVVQGHGIGLSIVQQIIQQYNGQISVQKSQEWGGAHFMICLPKP